ESLPVGGGLGTGPGAVGHGDRDRVPVSDETEALVEQALARHGGPA
ncbi:MAG: hypothetical protein JWN32_1950, partial [Solirubrobacterales bacterium]|nr:hypothetical protein [Solirubrobacterales bacterium]